MKQHCMVSSFSMYTKFYQLYRQVTFISTHVKERINGLEIRRREALKLASFFLFCLRDQPIGGLLIHLAKG